MDIILIEGGTLNYNKKELNDVIPTFSYGDVVEEKDDLDDSECPFCGEQMGQVMRDYTGYHSREILIHCDNEDCNNLYIRVYKFSHIIKFNKQEIKKEEN